MGTADIDAGRIPVAEGHPVERHAHGEHDLFIILAFVGREPLADDCTQYHAGGFLDVGAGAVFPFADLLVRGLESFQAVFVAGGQTQHLAIFQLGQQIRATSLFQHLDRTLRAARVTGFTHLVIGLCADGGTPGQKHGRNQAQLYCNRSHYSPCATQSESAAWTPNN